ncbi:putative nuclease HARBI1 [Austrofundulus limnaeus]|uniref:Putative nuclease HARBI1 n=1 Tax=Austrofundulus limnaeus TaxID=52670 RepID=A0A2I4CR77_AUSLI|nr:PREDICTED: putative nuclease HARBI1 [Austrofundulus limnaeus]
MAELLLLDALPRQALGRARVFQEHTDLLAESDEWLLSRFRLPLHVLLQICTVLEPQLARQTKRSNPIPPHLQILTSLGFLATGTFQREMGDGSGVSQSSVSLALPLVIKFLLKLTPRYITFPNTAAEQIQIKTDFHAIAGLPNTIGAIDCTHIRIKAPSPDAFPFLNRKQYHSINVQIISDSKYKLLNVVARWQEERTTHLCCKTAQVAYVLRKVRMEMAGDRGYALASWLMTPLTIPQTRQECLYNQLHTRTRAVVERTIGVLKARWMCLDTAGGKLLYTSEKACQIILACCILHNIAVKEGVPFPDPAPAEEMPQDPPHGPHQ